MDIKSSEILCVLANVVHSANVWGFVKAVAYKDESGSLESVTADLVPERGEIRVRSGLDNFDTGGIHANCFWLNGLDDDFNYDAERNQAKYSCPSSSLREVRRWAVCEVLDFEIGSKGIEQIRKIQSKFKTTEFVILHDTENYRYFGPFLVAGSSGAGNFTSLDGLFDVEVSPTTGPNYPEPFTGLKDSVYAVFEIRADAAESAIFEEIRDRRRFLVTENLSADALTLKDCASNEELKAYFASNSKMLHKQPKEVKETVEALVASAPMYQDPLAKGRIDRVVELQGGFKDLSDSFSDTDIKDYVAKNAEQLLSTHAAGIKADLEATRAEGDRHLKNVQKQQQQAEKAKIEAQKKSELANRKLAETQREIKGLIEERENERKEKIESLDQAIKEKEAKLSELEEENNALENTNKQWQGEIATSKETYIKDLLKHSAMIEALHGRSRGSESLPNFKSLPSRSETYDREGIIIDVAETARDFLDSHGRSFNSLESLALCASVIRSFVTVFHGDPGSGKTSLATLLLKFFDSDQHGGLEVQVQRGWSNSTELLGYENPLTGRREYDRYDFFRTLESINQSEDLMQNAPALVLLDEANLSPIEHYWSDFMNISDRFFQNPVLTRFPADQKSGLAELKIPSGLRFLATINTDSTTEQLSPRFVSRAAVWRIQSANPELITNGSDGEATKIGFNMSDLHEAFGVGQGALPVLENKVALDELGASFRELGLLSNRNYLAVVGFVEVLELYLRASNQNTLPALDLALLHFVIPNVRGFGSAYQSRLTDVATLLEQRGLTRASAEITQIVKEGANLNQYYRAV